MTSDNFAEGQGYQDLRARAAELLRGEELAIDDYSPENIQRLLYEIRVYHIELELQNEELRETQDRLAELRDKYSDLYNFAPIAYLTFDKDGVIRELNLAASELLGRERANLVNRPFIMYLGKESYQDFRLLLNSVSDDEIISKRVELTLNTYNGRVVPVEAEVNKVGQSNGDDVICRMILFDISERKKAEQAIIRAQKLESLSVLAGGVAHDFNNMLVAIQNQVSLAAKAIQANQQSDEANAHLQKAVRASERAGDLTRQLQAYAGHAAHKIEFIDLNQLVEENRALFASTATSRVNLSVRTNPDLPLIKADPGQIQQIIMNLIINAAEATENRPGVIRMETDLYQLKPSETRNWQIGERPPAPGAYISLTVSDNGKGMDQETLNRIFDPFYSTKFEGRGMGLAAVLGIMNNINGGILVESQKGIGSTFKLLIPAVMQGDPTNTRKLKETDTTKTETYQPSNQKILIIDDEPAVLEAVADILDVFEQEALPAHSGEEGLELLRKRQAEIQLVILDLTMPGLDGFQTLHHLRQISPDMPVLLSSGYTREDLLPRLASEKNVSFLQKPYSVHGLIDAIQSTLKNAGA